MAYPKKGESPPDDMLSKYRQTQSGGMTTSSISQGDFPRIRGMFSLWLKRFHGLEFDSDLAYHLWVEAGDRSFPAVLEFSDAAGTLTTNWDDHTHLFWLSMGLDFAGREREIKK